MGKGLGADVASLPARERGVQAGAVPARDAVGGGHDRDAPLTGRVPRLDHETRKLVERAAQAGGAVSVVGIGRLAVVVDDAAQGVNSVVRGVDLLCSTPQQIYLQNLLGLPHPVYGHIPLLVAERDRRLSKRDRDASLDALLARFGSPEAIIGHIAGITGLAPTADSANPEQLLSCFSLKNLHGRIQIAWI